MDSLSEGVLVIGNQVLKYYNKTLNKIIMNENNNTNQIDQEKEKEIFEKLKQIKDTKNNTSLYEIISTNDANNIFINNKVEFTFNHLDNQKNFEIQKMPINFNEELCTAYMIEDQTTTIQLEKQKMKDKYQRRYLASITHDLKTPINGIMGIIRIIIEKIRDLEIIGMLETVMK